MALWLNVNSDFQKLVTGLHCWHSRFKMLRLSSSSTAGLWLSLLRKNTRITFWTIFSLRRCWTFFPLFSLFNSKHAIEASACAKMRASSSRTARAPVQNSDYFGVTTFKTPHRGKKSGRAYKITRWGVGGEPERLKQEKQVRGEAQRWWWWSCALPLRAERTHFYALL